MWSRRQAGRFSLCRALLLALSIVACRRNGPASEKAPLAVAPAQPASEAPLAPTAEPVDPPEPIAMPPEASQPAGPGRIGCGTTTCSATTEVCCADTYRQHYVCARRLATPSPRLFERSGGPVDIDPAECVDARGDVMDHPKLWFCDGSDDCPEDEVCCRQALGWTMCVHAGTVPGGACDTGEVCSGGSCRARAATCEDGLCRKAHPSVACGGETCTKESPVCCVDGYDHRSCTARASCTSVLSAVMECRGAWDCLPGQRCCVGNTSYCAGRCDGMDTPTCSSDQECSRVRVPWVEGESMAAGRCKLVPYFGVKRCASPGQ